MANTPSLFGDNSSIDKSLLDQLRGINDALNTVSGGGMRRISIKGGRFRKYVGGDQIAVSKDNAMNIVIVSAAPIARTYYSGSYNPEKASPPACWSHDTKRPSDDVPIETKQASLCRDCPQDIKGSGQGNSKACRYSQRLAVCIEGDLDTVYQLQIPATSIFGDSENGRMPLGVYSRFLRENDDTPASAIVTEISFDENSETPKLFFKAIRPLEKEELLKVIDIKDSPEVIKCIEFTVAQTDGVQKAPVKETKQIEAPVAEEEEKVEPPKKTTKKAKTEPQEEEDLAEIIDGWEE